MLVNQRASCQWSSSTRFVIRCRIRACALRICRRFRRLGSLVVRLIRSSSQWQSRWMRPKAWWPSLPQSVSEKYVRKVRTPGVERDYAITAWGLNVALRRVRNDEPVAAALLHQSAFFVLRRDGFGHPQRSEHGVIDAVLRHGAVWYVA